MSSNTITTLEKFEKTIETLGKNKLDDYIKVSLKNNYMDKIPYIIWEMKNLKVIDLTYNNITELNSEKMSKMDSLKTIIIIENPIPKENSQHNRSILLL